MSRQQAFALWLWRQKGVRLLLLFSVLSNIIPQYFGVREMAR
ncbi:hypothetical protein [Nostoc sp. KVJ3]|nr:hypothetical protein [Nostoc sp. KVJ3]